LPRLSLAHYRRLVADLLLDATGDIIIDSTGDLPLVTGPDAIAQDANLRVALFVGEWPLDRRVGIDYRNLIFGRKPPDAVIRSIYDEVLRTTAGVTAVNQLTINFNRRTRALEVRAAVQTKEGTALVFRDVLLGQGTTTAAPTQPANGSTPLVSPTPTGLPLGVFSPRQWPGDEVPT
jgi:hypothetical protein